VGRLVAEDLTGGSSERLFHLAGLSGIVCATTAVLIEGGIVHEIVSEKKVSILRRDGVVTDFRSLRSVLAIVRLETVVVLEVFLS